MVIVSHDRAFLDQLSTKIVETDMGVARTFPGNYSEYVGQKAADYEAQLMAWEKQQKEIERQQEIIDRLSGGANTGRAAMAEKVCVLCAVKDFADTSGHVEDPSYLWACRSALSPRFQQAFSWQYPRVFNARSQRTVCGDLLSWEGLLCQSDHSDFQQVEAQAPNLGSKPAACLV